MENYINNIVNKILVDKFQFKINFNIEKYRIFLTEDRLKEIKTYNMYGLVSPQIYNICYFYLTKEKGLSKQGVKDCFVREVNKNKEKMNMIQSNDLTSMEYFRVCYEEIKPKEKSKNKELKDNLDSTEYIGKGTGEDILKVQYTCENCMVMRKGDCIGEKKICSYFKYVRTIKKEEIELWPDEMGYRDSYYHRK